MDFRAIGGISSLLYQYKYICLQDVILLIEKRSGGKKRFLQRHWDGAANPTFRVDHKPD